MFKIILYTENNGFALFFSGGVRISLHHKPEKKRSQRRKEASPSNKTNIMWNVEIIYETVHLK